MYNLLRVNRKKSAGAFGSAWWLVLISIPFIQLGLSYYVSVQILLFVLIGSKSLLTLRYHSAQWAMLFLGASCFVLKFCILIGASAPFKTAFIPIRELVCFSIFLLAIDMFKDDVINIKSYNFWSIMVMLCLFLLVLIQLFSISRGKYFGFPKDFFTFNMGTLDGVDLALKNGTRFRPTGFYGEPSYTAFVSLSLMVGFLMLNCSDSLGRNIIVMIVGLLTLFVSGSFSGVLATSSMICAWFMWKGYMKKGVWIGFSMYALMTVALVFIVMYIVFSSPEILGRFSAIYSGEDLSANDRFSVPLNIIGEQISSLQIFGTIDITEIQINNAFFGLFIQYGLLAFLPVVIILYTCWNPISLLYIFLCMNFNGAFLRFDKAIIMACTLGIIAHSFRKKNQAKTQELM